MSMRSLLLAVRDRVRQRVRGAVEYTEGECGVQPDGMPDPRSGQVYVSVHPGMVVNDSDQSLDETYEVKLTVTVRAGWAPVDRHGDPLLVAQDTGLYARVEALRARLHMDYTVLDKANAGEDYSIGAAENGFVEPLKFRRMGEVQVKGPEWFHAEAEAETAGLAVELVFGGARRVQVIQEQS